MNKCDEKAIEDALRGQTSGKGRPSCEIFESDDARGHNRNIKHDSYNQSDQLLRPQENVECTNCKPTTPRKLLGLSG